MLTNHFYPLSKPVSPMIWSAAKVVISRFPPKKEWLFLYESGCPDNKTEGCSFLHGLNELIHAAGQRPDLPVHLQFKKERSQLADGNVHRQGDLVDVRFPLLA